MEPGRDHPAIGRIGDALDPARTIDQGGPDPLPARGDVPQANGRIDAPGDERLAVGREGDGENGLPVPGEPTRLGARQRVPEDDLARGRLVLIVVEDTGPGRDPFPVE